MERELALSVVGTHRHLQSLFLLVQLAPSRPVNGPVPVCRSRQPHPLSLLRSEHLGLHFDRQHVRVWSVDCQRLPQIVDRQPFWPVQVELGPLPEVWVDRRLLHVRVALRGCDREARPDHPAVAETDHEPQVPKLLLEARLRVVLDVEVLDRRREREQRRVPHDRLDRVAPEPLHQLLLVRERELPAGRRFRQPLQLVEGREPAGEVGGHALRDVQLLHQLGQDDGILRVELRHVVAESPEPALLRVDGDRRHTEHLVELRREVLHQHLVAQVDERKQLNAGLRVREEAVRLGRRQPERGGERLEQLPAGNESRARGRDLSEQGAKVLDLFLLQQALEAHAVRLQPVLLLCVQDRVCEVLLFRHQRGELLVVVPASVRTHRREPQHL
mmetsp:Transcript_3932/g.9587  ORF Transcript_3932/g.9587 Transcript_3932/m.9587 type:complete len:387 (-) Transcript_3932:6150-7310(-)